MKRYDSQCSDSERSKPYSAYGITGETYLSKLNVEEVYKSLVMSNALADEFLKEDKLANDLRFGCLYKKITDLITRNHEDIDLLADINQRVEKYNDFFAQCTALREAEKRAEERAKAERRRQEELRQEQERQQAQLQQQQIWMNAFIGLLGGVVNGLGNYGNNTGNANSTGLNMDNTYIVNPDGTQWRPTGNDSGDSSNGSASTSGKSSSSGNNNSGANTIIKKDAKMCPQCYGSGKCHSCSGKGIYIREIGQGYRKCPHCVNHNGICRFCKGTGEIEIHRYSRQ